MAFFRTVSLADQMPAVAGDGVVLRTPQMSDWGEWTALREASRDFLTPWEPTWPADDLTRAAFRRRLKRYTEDLRSDQAYPFFVFRKVMPTPQLANVRLMVNGGLRGLFTVRQVWDSESLGEHFQEPIGPVYRLRPPEPWDGRWSIALLEHTPNRTVRERVQRGLEYLGYRQAHPDGWIAPRPAPELESVTTAEGIPVTHFLGELDGDDEELVERLWQPRALASAYLHWLDDARQLVAAAGPGPDERAAFAVRSTLLHEWRKFLFSDPGLPKELLPPDWPGQVAAEYFDAESARLLPAASAYVDHCLQRRDP